MTKNTTAGQTPLEQLAEQIYCRLAQQFPVCCASDEFYFFPQVSPKDGVNWGWDDFSPASLGQLSVVIATWQAELNRLQHAANSQAEQIDAELLREMLQTLLEQLQLVAPQRRLPSFHLSVLVAGLAETLDEAGSDGWEQRVAELPRFLQQAAGLLDQVPRAFLLLGQQMLADLQSWFDQLEATGRQLGAGRKALNSFAEALQQSKICEDFRLPAELYERLVIKHLGCDLSLAAIERELQAEYLQMESLLIAEAERLLPGREWQQAETEIPLQLAPENDLRCLYQPELNRQEAHLRSLELLPTWAGDLHPDLLEVPLYMEAIRASDAYSARVGHPARGGTFYLQEKAPGSDGQVGRTLEYRMTAAHEVWPGHHLLDLCRWNLPQPIRRPLERPLCYEGWACFAEQLLAETGYFTGPWDRFLLARRRIERAARGLVDIGLQTGQMNFVEAARQLEQVGYPPEKAAGVVPKYALRPGYQVCYTLGLRQMLELKISCAAMGLKQFVAGVLSQGQIGFARLWQVLLSGGD